MDARRQERVARQAARAARAAEREAQAAKRAEREARSAKRAEREARAAKRVERQSNRQDRVARYGGARAARPDLRIVITSPPKSGNTWLKCLLSRIYELKWLLGGSKSSTNPDALRRWIERGQFEAGSILHQHCRFTPQLCDVIEAAPAKLVTIVRDPYDVFVSYYHWVQDRAENAMPRSKGRPRDTIIGKPLDHPDVLDYLANEFRDNLYRAHVWMHSRRAIVVRYENLHADPVAELTRVTDQIRPVDRARIEAAIEACSVENMRKMSAKMTRHVRSAKVGESKQTLGAAHLEIFRRHHADLIRGLGYEVR